MNKKISLKTERKLYQVIGMLGVLAEVESSGNEAILKRILENCSLTAEGAKGILEDAAEEITQCMNDMEND